MSAPVDIGVEKHGTLFLLTPLTSRAELWLKQNTDPKGQRFGRALAVESRYLGDIVRGALKAGLIVR